MPLIFFMAKGWFIIGFLCLGLFLLSCQEREMKETADRKSKIINPNGDSELALLMRDMFDEGMLMKTAIMQGKSPRFSFAPEAIFTAHATEPEKVAGEPYQSLGRAYIAAAKALESAAPDERKTFFQGMVHTCMACHEQVCPGPTRRIKRLYYDDL